VIVAIDGPAASGKSTVAKALAAHLGSRYLDTGAMYRAVAWRALDAGVALDDEAGLTRLADAATIAFEPTEGGIADRDGGGATHSVPPPERVLIDGNDVTRAIRTPAVDDAVSPVAAAPGVRRAMVAAQRALAEDGDFVVEGRDIGTTVFPDADVKVFLTASSEERARRRTLDMEAGGQAVTAREVGERLERRDHYDSNRAASPLVRADDAVELDTTGLTVDEVVERIAALVPG
jgi:cytidylate kinase